MEFGNTSCEGVLLHDTSAADCFSGGLCSTRSGGFLCIFELSLIPMYFLIGIWGGADRIQATVKFFIYTLTGSLIMLVALLYLGYHAGTFHPDFLFTADWRFISSSDYQIGLAEQKIGRASCRERVSS